MTKNELCDYLILNPEYSSPWVNRASTIMTEFPEYTEEFCAKYNSDQLGVIYDILKYNATSKDHKINIDFYADPKFNDTQMHIFYLVFTQCNGDYEEALERMADPKYPYEKMNYVASALISGLDLTDHLDTFSANQIAMIWAGYKDGVDIRLYDDARIPAETMNVMRTALSLGHEYVSYDFGSEMVSIKAKK